MEGLGDVGEVLGVQTGDRDTSVHSHVDGVVLTELVNHILVKSSEGEHANLVGDMGPVVLVTELLEGVDETVTHLLHAAGHVSQVLVPHGGEGLVTEDDVDDTGTVHGRVRVDWAGNLLDAAHNDILLGGRAGDHGVATGTLTVETEVLGE